MDILKYSSTNTYDPTDPTAIVREDRPIYNITRAGANTLFGLSYSEDSGIVGFNLAGDIYNFVDEAPDWEKDAVADFIRKAVVSISRQLLHVVSNLPITIRFEVLQKVVERTAKLDVITKSQEDKQ